MKWKIDNIEVKNQVVLAPLAGVSNPAYMKICEEMGVGLVVTELISSEAIVRNNKKTFDMLNGIEDIKIPVAIQLFGSNPDVMAQAAKIIANTFKVDIIDINMGCPVPKVAIKSQAGAYLLKHPNSAFSIMKAVVDAVDVPVTVKIRSGWDSNSINAVKIAKLAEKAGVKAICVHPRTRSQGYGGSADWSIIKDVKENVNIHVIGNGDIKNVVDAKRMLEETSCDAIMIGRSSLGNPWLIKNIVNYLNNEELMEITLADRIDMCLYHLSLLVRYKGEKIACLEIRNHINWYFRGMKSLNEFRNKIYQTNKIHDIISLLNNLKEEYNGK